MLGASWLACRLPEGPLFAARRARRRAVVPARARAAPPRRAATSAGCARRWPRRGRGSAARPRRRDRPATPSSASSAPPSATPPATTSRSPATRASTRELRRRAARARHARAHRRGRRARARPVLFVGLHFGSIELPVAVPRVPGRRRRSTPMETIDDPALQAYFERTRGVGRRPPRRAARGAPRADRRARATAIPVGLVGDRDLTGGGIADPAVRGARRRCRWVRRMLAVETRRRRSTR